MPISKLTGELDTLKTSIETEIPLISEVTIFDQDLQDVDTNDFHRFEWIEDNEPNYVRMRLITDDEGLSATMEKLPGTWDQYIVRANAEMLVKYDKIERNSLLENILALFKCGPEVTEVMWETSAIFRYYEEEELSNVDMNLLLIRFVVESVVNLADCSDICIKEC